MPNASGAYILMLSHAWMQLMLRASVYAAHGKLQCPACIAMLTVTAPVTLLSRYCKEAENSVMEFKAAVHKAEAKCRLISETTLLKVERKRMYEHREFAAQQAEHHTKVSCNSCDNKCLGYSIPE